MDLGIKNKRVLITGGSKGIGYEIARLFANEGCKVSIIARNKAKLRKLVNKIGGKGQGHNFCSQDLRKKNAVSIFMQIFFGLAFLSVMWFIFGFIVSHNDL